MEVTIECRWTKEDIEEMLLEKMHGEGLKIIPQPKKKKDDPDRIFVWPRSNKVKVRARAIIDPNARQAEEEEEEEEESEEPRAPKKKKSEPMDLSLLPEGANVDAIRAIENAANAEDPLEAAAKRRRLSPGESRERDD